MDKSKKLIGKMFLKSIILLTTGVILYYGVSELGKYVISNFALSNIATSVVAITTFAVAPMIIFIGSGITGLIILKNSLIELEQNLDEEYKTLGMQRFDDEKSIDDPVIEKDSVDYGYDLTYDEPTIDEVIEEYSSEDLDIEFYAYEKEENEVTNTSPFKDIFKVKQKTRRKKHN